MIKRLPFSLKKLIAAAVLISLAGFWVYLTHAANPNLPGDVNNDGVVNITDLSILLTNFGTTNASVDLNGDNKVDILDLSILLSHYGQSQHAVLNVANLKTANFNGTLLGAYVNPNNTWAGDADAEQKVTTYESLINHLTIIDHHYYGWTDNWPSGLESWDKSGGRIPMDSWGGPVTIDSVISGSQDTIITQHAQAAANYSSPIFLRPLWEMNGNWTQWNATNYAQNTANYITAWRRIYNIFQSAGATNVIFVWAPNSGDVPLDSWNHWTNYYPGDPYVNWVGIDGYNWGTTQTWSSWQSFQSTMQPIYNDYSARKPIMISETSSVETGGSKSVWISDMQNAIKSSMPKVKAVVWFDNNKEVDWRVDSSTSSLNSYKVMSADSYFNP